LGTAYFLLGETEGAEDQWLAIPESAPGRLRFVTDYNLGLLYYNLRDFSQSEDRFRRALKLNPGDRDSKINLELALRGRKALEEQPGGESRQAEVPPLSLNRMENILERLKSLETMGSGKPLPDQGAGGPGDW
ncbi:MAG: tetratricopeptide repeat protein, partial [Spirochaetales bacterium]